MSGHGEPPTWMASAACIERDDVDWFPDLTDMAGIAKAKAVCASCEVWPACLLDALAREGQLPAEERYGVLGHHSPVERERIARGPIRRWRAA